MAYKPTYLQKIKASRGIRPVGEVFAMHLQGVGYLFGRVIRNDCASGGITDPRPWPRQLGYYLVYIYKDTSDSIGHIPTLKRSRLLTPPMTIGGYGWKLGYFVPVRRDTLTQDDIFPVHCFRNDIIQLVGKPPVTYLDEDGNWLDKRSNPCSEWGRGEYGSTEAAIAKALGLPHPELPGWVEPPQTEPPLVSLASIPAGRRRDESLAEVRLPHRKSDEDFDELEEALIAAVKKHKAGKWEGHETNLESGSVSIRFYGRDPRALLLTIQHGLAPFRKARRLPRAWSVTIRLGDDGETKRIKL